MGEKKLQYEKPELVDLSISGRPATAHGANCGSGSGASGNCVSGSSASFWCADGSSPLPGECAVGTGP
jgi:hypothetical protein